MAPARQKLESLGGTGIVLGPLLIVVGAVLLASTPPILATLGVVGLALGVPLFLGGLVARALAHAAELLREHERE